MFQRKKELLTFIDELQELYKKVFNVAPLLLEGNIEVFDEKQKNIKNQVFLGELLVPLVGGFSAGKSSAINKILGQDLLSVAITPETSTPAEVRYSVQEYIKVIRQNGEIEQIDISLLPTLTQQAEHIKYVQLFLNNSNLKKIQPFTLVDMPGFNSPLAQHESAINRYLMRGVFYFYFVSCQDGSLTELDIARINADIKINNRKFAVVVTKKDLKSTFEIQDIKNYIQNQLLIYDLDSYCAGVLAIDVGDTNLLLEQLERIDQNEIFNDFHINTVRDLYFSVESDLNTVRDALTKSKKEIEDNVNNLKNSLEKLEQEKEDSIRALNAESTSIYEKAVLEAIERGLYASIDELISAAKQDGSAIGEVIIRIVKNVLLEQLKTITEELSESLAHEFANSISNTALNVDVSKDWLENIIDLLQTEIMHLLIDGPKHKDDLPAGGVMALSSLALLIPHPIVKTIMTILPLILNVFFKWLNSSREDSRYKDAVLNQVIPSVLNEYRRVVSELLKKIKELMIVSLSKALEDKIQAEKTIMNNAINKNDPAKIDVDNSIYLLNNIINELFLLNKKFNIN